MATHSSILAWRTPWTEEPGELQSVGSQRVRHTSDTLKVKPGDSDVFYKSLRITLQAKFWLLDAINIWT